MPPIPELETIRKAQILAAAQVTIADRGCANVTMEDIATAAGLSKGGLAHYFKSKRELFLAVFNDFFDKIFQRSRDTIVQFDHPMDQLLSFDWLYNFEDPDINIGFPILMDFMSIAVRDDEYRRIFHDWIDNWVVLLRGAIETGIARGIFARVDPEPTARTISAIYQGVVTRWYLDPAPHPTRWAIASFTQAIEGLMRPHLTIQQAEGGENGSF
ncbi:MAG: TetR/AcrR family transcriptional regulator [Desulfobacterales bacterium]|nr:TetR/AcrR family transcriptional regulator [Desulfobacterales bacterium]